MSDSSPTTPPGLSEAAPEGRLARAVELVTDEAVEALQKGRDPRAYARVEALLKIARALRKQIGTRADDFEVGQSQSSPLEYVGPEDDDMRINVGTTGIVMGQGQGRGAQGDLEREKDLSLIEMREATRRRDEAATRVSMLEELDVLRRMIGEVPGLARAPVERRMAEILATIAPPQEQPEEDEPCQTDSVPTVG